VARTDRELEDKDYMEKISIFNYEAYYLDFLEGNLSEQDTALLLTFLEEHPELKIEDDFLPQFNHTDRNLDAEFKAGLKQVDLKKDLPNLQNAEQFIIAEMEGLLSPDRSTDLSDLLQQNEALRELHSVYKQARLMPDAQLTYADKHLLKQKTTLRLWPAIAFAAAASVSAFFFFIQPADTNLKGGSAFSGVVGSLVVDKSHKVEKKPTIALDPSGLPSETKPKNKQHDDKIQENKSFFPERFSPINDMTLRAAHPFRMDVVDLELIENTLALAAYEERYQKNDYAVLGVQDMNNPIKPITNRFGDLVKQDVDFRSAKATEKNSGGFYIKIGKFEVSHKKH